MKYSKFKTLKLAVNFQKQDCLQNLNTLVVAEGCTEAMPFFMNNEVVIDMDCVERKLAISNRRLKFKSMDSAFVNSIDEIVLVEFRFNYVNMKNLDKSSLFGKVSGSTAALAGYGNIHNKYFFIFDSSLKNQAIRRFRDMNPSMPQNYIATDLNDLKATYF